MYVFDSVTKYMTNEHSSKRWVHVFNSGTKLYDKKSKPRLPVALTRTTDCSKEYDSFFRSISEPQPHHWKYYATQITRKVEFLCLET